VTLEKHGIACDMMHGFNWDKWTTGKPTERLALIPAGQEHILVQHDGKKRWVQVVTELSRAFALCAGSDEAIEIRDDVSFFQALQAALNKQSSANRKTPEQIDAAIRQLVSKAITTEGQVIDVFTAAGLPKPDISILSDQFLAEVRGLKHKNVAAELLEKLLKGELKVRSKHNLVQSQGVGSACRRIARRRPAPWTASRTALGSARLSQRLQKSIHPRDCPSVALRAPQPFAAREAVRRGSAASLAWASIIVRNGRRASVQGGGHDQVAKMQQFLDDEGHPSYGP
jgi:Domain of unknown function (DUF3387)